MIDKNTKDFIKQMPKIELHLHLDGSLNIDLIKKKYNLTDEEVKQKLIADEECIDLNSYLTKFEYSISIMQTKEELVDVTYNLLNRLKEQNVIYVEIRFAPQFHTKKGLTQEEVVSAILEGKSKVDIKSNVILCIMRGQENEEENYETINIAKKYLGKGIVAVDLAGAESIFKTEDYEEIFKYVKKIELPYTIHAGEADGPESIKSAIKFGATRIGHGVRVVEDEDLIKVIKSKEVILEVCPTSNIQTCIFKDYTSHPLEMLYNQGVITTINTDNMTVSNTTLENEYMKIIENTNLTIEDLVEMNKNSIKAAFLDKSEKLELLREIDKYVEKLGGV